MAETSPVYIIDDVEALWPRINCPYRFDQKERRSVPCDPFDDGAKYEINFKMSKAQAKELRKNMVEAYDGKVKSEKDWPKSFENPFTKDEDGNYIYKANLKGAYGKDATRKPVQFDAKNTKLGDDFLLTTGSKINVAVTFTPYHGSMGTGVSLRLRAVQVIKYAPLEAFSPFGATEGFEASEGNPFVPGAKGESNGEIKEPKKVVKKSTAVPKSKDPELDAIVDDWDD